MLRLESFSSLGLYWLLRSISSSAFSVKKSLALLFSLYHLTLSWSKAAQKQALVLPTTSVAAEGLPPDESFHWSPFDWVKTQIILIPACVACSVGFIYRALQWAGDSFIVPWDGLQHPPSERKTKILSIHQSGLKNLCLWGIGWGHHWPVCCYSMTPKPVHTKDPQKAFPYDQGPLNQQTMHQNM